MIIKVIQHKNMKNSVNYLYSKMDKNPRITGSHSKYLTNETAKDFLYQSDRLRNDYSEHIAKSLETSNNIKHLMLSFHHKDSSVFDDVKDKIIADLFNKLGIDPETHLTNIFIHNDKNHPHFHVIFSRVGEGNSIFNDKKIGKRIGDFAKEMNRKYGLFHPEKSESKITFDSKYLQNPTLKGDLLKLIDFATMEATGIENFQNVMKRNGVNTKINKDGELIYMLPNVNAPSPEEVKHLIDLARRNTKTKDEFKLHLQKKGIFVKFQADGKESFSVKKVIAWKEDTLPKACRLKQIYRQIRTRSHDPNYIEARLKLVNGIESCRTLGEIKALLPGSEIKFDQRGSKVYNVSIEYKEMVIRLHEVFTKEISMDIAKYTNDPFTVPIIFIPRSYNRDAAEWEFLQKKSISKRKNPPFRL